MPRLPQRVAGRLALCVSLLILAGCRGADGPRPLVLGEDSCDYCRMSIADTRYGGEVETRSGKILTFDAVECLVGYLAAARTNAGLRGVWVADYDGGGMIPAASALFLRGGSLHSPMGRQLTSFAPTVTTDVLTARYGGEALTWNAVLALAPTPPSGATPEPSTR